MSTAAVLTSSQCTCVGGAGIVFNLCVWRIVLRDALVVGFNRRATLSNFIVLVIVYAACNLAFYTQLIITRELSSRAFFAVYMLGSNLFFASLWVVFSGCIKQIGGSSSASSHSWSNFRLRERSGCLWDGNRTVMILIEAGNVVLLAFHLFAIVWMFVRCNALSTFYRGDVYMCSNVLSVLLGGVYFLGMRRVAGQMLAIRNFSQTVADVTGVQRLATITSRIWIACSISCVCLGLHCLGLFIFWLQIDEGVVTALWLTIGQFTFSGVPILAFLLIVTPEMANRESQGVASPAFRNGATVSIASSYAGEAHAATVPVVSSAFASVGRAQPATEDNRRNSDASEWSCSVHSSQHASAQAAPPASVSQNELFVGSVTEDAAAPYRFRFRWRKFLSFVGPGFLMSLAYLDPGNIEVPRM
jgi:hypothetical protein